jgi:hypothetical protein
MELVSGYPPSTKITPPHQQPMFLSWRLRFHQVQNLFEKTNMTFNSSTFMNGFTRNHIKNKNIQFKYGL